MTCRSSRRERPRIGGRIRCIALVLGLQACGADGTDAPFVAAPGEAGPCGTLQSITQVTRSALHGGLFDRLGQQLKRVLVDTGQYRVFFKVAITLVRQAPLRDILDAATQMAESGISGSVLPALFNVVDYITGRSPHVPGEHYELTNVAERVFRYCDPRADFATLRRLLQFEIPCASCPGGRQLFAPELLRASSALLQDPVFVTFLDDFTFVHEGETRLGVDAYAQLMDLVLQNLASPSFDWSYVRGLVDDAVTRNLTGDTHLRFDALLDLVAQAVDPGAGLLADLQIFVGCLHRHDENKALARLSYDFAVSPGLEMGDILEAAADAYDSQGGSALLFHVAEIFGIFERDTRLAGSFLASVAPLLGESSSRQMLPAMSDLRGKGVAQEIADDLRLFLSSCVQEPP
ncbi:MAG: hypothetical protein ABIJ09_23365 [Pseudomonadota bacterium]